jgi:DtxR family transcriptional regulator, Mn-dependent transcriptional regulator
MSKFSDGGIPPGEQTMRNRSTEDYLKAICRLEEEVGRASTTSLARHLGLAGASITAMLKRLSADGLVEYEPYRGVALSREGRRVALRTLRRHRLWEMYLVRHLGFSWDQIHAEAERLEHATSDLLEKRLDQALGSPTVDPHGDPIPSERGVLRQTRQVTLADSPPGSTVLVLRVRDAETELLKYMTHLGIGLSTRILVKEVMGFDGSLRVRIESQEHFLSQKLARSIIVCPARPTRQRKERKVNP